MHASHMIHSSQTHCGHSSPDKMRKAEAEKQQVVQPQPLKASDVFSSGSDDESTSSSSSGSDQADSEDEGGGR